MRVESGFTRKFFVVRRALDAYLMEDGINGRRARELRNEEFASGRKGTTGFMLALGFCPDGKSCSFDVKARDRLWSEIPAIPDRH